jgi:uncharacterized protein HemY
MGLAWDLAEAVNIGWSEVTNQGAASLRDRFADRSFRRAIARELEAHDPSIDKSSVRKVMASHEFLEWLAADEYHELTDFLSDDTLAALRVGDTETARALGSAIGQALGAVAFKRATWVERELLSGIRSTGASSQVQVTYLREIWDLLSSALRPAEKTPGRDDGAPLSPFANHVDYKTWVRERRGGLASTLVPYVPPEPTHPAHPASLWQRLATQANPALLIHGPGGSGKTRTCIEVGDLAIADGWQVIHVLPGEPSATVEGLAEELLAASDPTLIVLDYLNELQSLDIRSLADRLLPVARRGGVRTSLLASARSGWLSLKPDLGPFELVALDIDSDFQGRVTSAIAEHVAPQAIAAWGKAEVIRLCGSRPMIGMLVARELERLREQGETSPSALTSIGSADLLGWLRRRLAEDGLSVIPRSRPTELDTLSDALVVATAAVIALPGSHDRVENAANAAAAALGVADPEPFGRRVVRLLQRLGWVISTDRRLHATHDVVIDFLASEVLSAYVEERGDLRASPLLSGGIRQPRTLGRIATNLSRVVADVDPVVAGPAQEFTRILAHWFEANAAAIGASMLGAGDVGETSFALGALVSGPPWQASTLLNWQTVIQPWLDINGTVLAARHLLFVGLRKISPEASGALEQAAFAWLRVHRERPEAGFVLGPLLGREGLNDPKHAEQIALTWLDANNELPEAGFVLRPLLGRDKLNDPEHAERVALTWLDKHHERPDAGFVLGPLLGREKFNYPEHAERVALTWLDKYHERPEAGFVLGPLLGLENPNDPEHAERAALKWLDEHHERPDAQFVLNSLLRGRNLNDPGHAERVALAWLDQHHGLPEAGFVLHSLLDRKDLNNPEHAEQFALAWLDEHHERPDAVFVLSPLLNRERLDEPEHAERIALEWLEHAGADEPEAATFVLRGLLQRKSLSDPARTEVAALAWLEGHGTADPEAATFVLRQLLRRAKLCSPRRAEIAALAWLDANRDRPDAVFVLRALLDREHLDDPGRAESAARAWLDEHHELPEAGFVLRSLLGRKKLNDSEYGELTALEWLDTNRGRPEAGFVLGPLLDREDLEDPERTEDAALEWLEHHGGDDPEAATFVLRRLLRRETLCNAARADAVALEWLGEFAERLDSQYVLEVANPVGRTRDGRSLAALAARWWGSNFANSHVRLLDNPRWLDFFMHQVVYVSMTSDERLLSPIAVDAFIIKIAEFNRTGIIAALVDDLILDWVRWPLAMSEGPPAVLQRPDVVSRIASLVRARRVGNSPALDRVGTWVSGWDDDLRELPLGLLRSVQEGD